MQPFLLAFILLLQHQQLLAGRLAEQQLAGATDDGRSSVALSDNLNSTLVLVVVPGKTIKAIERQMKAANKVASGAADKLQVAPANQLPANTAATSTRPAVHRTLDSFMAATMATGNQLGQGEPRRLKGAATLEAISATTAPPPAAGVSVAAASAAITAAIQATAATSPTREQHTLPLRPAVGQMAGINVPATIEDQIGRAVIPSKTNMAETAVSLSPTTTSTIPIPTPSTTSTSNPPTEIIPVKTKRSGSEKTNKIGLSVRRDEIKFNPDAALTHGYANATEAWPTMTTANIVAAPAAPTILPALTSTESRIGGKAVPTPRLLGSGAASVAQILAKSLDSPPPSSSSGWPVKHAAVLEGDVILGGLMMVHSREDSITCGPIMPQGGIQALEAMLYTLDQVNKQQLLPNVTLGAHLLDDCDKDTYGLEMAVDFIKGSISNIDDAEYHCNKTQVRKVISGVVGAASSVTSIQVANLLRLFRIPQVSYFSTSPELSNKQRFEYFSRTIPSDHYQVKAMVEIVKRMGWSYVSIIYEESNYGIKAFEELEELLARHNICIAIKEKLVKDSGVAEDIAYDNIVQKLLTKPRARGAIIFGSDQEVRQVMRAVRRANATGSFSWIGSDGWSARNLVSDDYEPEVEGTLSVQPQANPVRGFEEYFLSLTVENNQRNPWFVEFWEDHFQCRYPGSTSTPYNNYTKQCTKKERLSRQNTDFEDQLQFVSDAVMAFAYALRDMHRDLCGGGPSLCEAMKPTKGADLLKYLRKVEFEGLSGDEFRFDGNGDGPARYNIIHFKQSQAGQYHWVKVGEYTEGELRLNMSEVKFKRLSPKPPESVCSLPCLVGQAKKYVEGESCCWHCFNCTTYQIRHPDDETHCKLCKLGTLPDAHKQYCRPIPEIYLRPESAWAIGAMAFSATGILVTLFVMGVFVRHNDTPIVRASGRELSYILLAGIFMCYGVTFALVLKPTNIVCAIQRFGVGFCFTVVYAALLTKTNRIARIFKAGKQSAKRPSFISPKSQLVICACLVSVQILINGVWMVIAPSHAMHHYPTREDNLLVCDSYIDASYMIAFSYPIFLIVICTVYAVLTRKIPEAFNESKHIGFTMYTTCVIWLAFVPLYFGTANHVPLRITSMSVTISLSASVTIACLFSPKLYIILIRPERNVRQSMMPPRYGNMHRTAGTGPSSMMAAAVVTAATCAQEEKIQKHITPTNTENSLKTKKLCEMATQTISSIITSLDINAYNQIPYADQYVPNNTTTATTTPTEKGSGNGSGNGNGNSNTNGSSNSNSNSNGASDGGGDGDGDVATEQVVANNNKINQRQHGQPAVAFAITSTNNHISGPAATITTTAATGETTSEALVASITTPSATGNVSETTSVAPSNGQGNGSQRPPVLQTNL
ncbi:metabotropic glutamate receptor 2 isoform X2 [Drosophila teissieri]|uniref:metabotropic glutamate receptor 2 isoform X2 n=1 Tax=Drosophila teissieri TaxID=7243 RepID=UPI001CBA19B1|nr:metabotropic glutamate receptor 2 isoform X2 [Drosophila teissieri]